CHETRGVRNAYFFGLLKRKTILSGQLDHPGRVQQQVDVAQVLRRYTGNPCGCSSISIPVVFAANQWRQEFRVKATILVSELVARGRRLVFAQEFFFKPGAQHAITQNLFPKFELDWNRDVGVESQKWLVGNGLRERVVSEKAVCPAADDDHLRK